MVLLLPKIGDRSYLKGSVLHFGTGSFLSYNRDRDRTPGCLKIEVYKYFDILAKWQLEYLERTLHLY